MPGASSLMRAVRGGAAAWPGGGGAPWACGTYRVHTACRTYRVLSVATQVERTLPYWSKTVTPALTRGKTVLIAAHGNSIRGMLKYLDGISDEEITSLEIPTGIPLVPRLC